MARYLRRLDPTDHAVGTDRTIIVSLRNVDGSLLSVVGATATAKFFRSRQKNLSRPMRGSAVLTLTSAAGDITLTLGQAVIALQDTHLGGKSGDHWYTLEITASGGDIIPQGEGEIRLRRASTE